MHIQLNKQLIKRRNYWEIFPFIINNGAVPLTQTGYKPINSKISDFMEYELILTGNTLDVRIWIKKKKKKKKNINI